MSRAPYETVGAALRETLADGLGPAFISDVRAAWVALYAHVSRSMQAVAELPA